MAYEKHSWVTGETITADLLNNIEQGIADAYNTQDIEISASVDDSTGTPNVSVSGSDGSYVFSFTGLKGEKGDKGDKGDTAEVDLSDYYTGEYVLNNFASKNEISAYKKEVAATYLTKDSAKIYDLGNFDSLDAVSLNLGYNEIYNAVDKQIMYFSVNNTDFGIIINNVGEAVDGLPYYAKQYMYYQRLRYSRDVRRGSDGNVSYTAWALDTYNVLPNKYLQFSKLAELTTESSDSDIQSALMSNVTTSSTAAITADELDSCLTLGLTVRDAETATPIIISKPYSGTNLYNFTYVGYSSPKGSTADTLGSVTVKTVTIKIEDGAYSVYKAADSNEFLTTAYEKLPVNAQFYQVFTANTGTSYLSVSDILTPFGVSSADELLTAMKNTSQLVIDYLNSSSMVYHNAIQFIELINSNNTIHMVANTLDGKDDSCCRMEIWMNIDGSNVDAEQTGNVKLVKESLVLKSQLDALEARVYALENPEDQLSN